MIFLSNATIANQCCLLSLWYLFHIMSVHYIFLTQPRVICLSTELHQEFQGQTNRQTSILPQSNDESLSDGRTRLWLRLSSAPHGTHWTPSSHLRQRIAHMHNQPQTRSHIRVLQTCLSQLGFENLTLPCQPNQLPIKPTGIRYVLKLVPHQKVGGFLSDMLEVLFIRPIWPWSVRYECQDTRSEPFLLNGAKTDY